MNLRLILYSQAVKGQQYNAKFAIVSIRSLKKYNPQFIIVDKVYGLNSIITCISKEIKVSEIIRLNPTSDKVWYEIKYQKYSKNNVKSLFGVMKKMLRN